MKKRGSPPKRSRRAAAGATLSREGFARISAVEGIRLTPAMQRRAAEFERKSLSPEERIRAIVAIHRKG